jgi:putative transposase
MPNFRRYYIPNAIYFIVTVTRGRRKVFSEAANADLLYVTLREVGRTKPFRLWAHALIPDHLNLLIQPTNEANISQIMLSLKRSFTLSQKEARGITDSLSLWQRRFWDHIIRDEEDLQRHFDYIHYQPVKHGLVTRPEDYPYSSYRYWLERGYYELGWGYAEPKSVEGMEFE